MTDVRFDEITSLVLPQPQRWRRLRSISSLSSSSNAELSTHFDIMDCLRYLHNVPIELIKNNKSFTDPDSSSIAPNEQRGHRNIRYVAVSQPN